MANECINKWNLINKNKWCRTYRACRQTSLLPANRSVLSWATSYESPSSFIIGKCRQRPRVSTTEDGNWSCRRTRSALRTTGWWIAWGWKRVTRAITPAWASYHLSISTCGRTQQGLDQWCSTLPTGTIGRPKARRKKTSNLKKWRRWRRTLDRS